jgi:nitrogen fixation/metabolism regulation signal transduction histidine kinase
MLDRLVLASLRRLTAGDVAVEAEREEMHRVLAARVEQQRRLRHDIRGVLSPVLLTADRLSNHADPAVKRSGEILSRTVDRATAMLAEAADAASNPLADP